MTSRVIKMIPRVLALFVVSATASLRAQDNAPNPPPAPTPAAVTPIDTGRQVSWETVIPNLASDQKNMWLFPVRMFEGKKKRYIFPTLAVIGTTAALIALDPHTAPYFRKTTEFQGFNNVFTGTATEVGTIVPPITMYVAGLISHDAKMKSTAMLAGEALANSEILTTVMKDIDRRTRPASIAPNGNFTDTWFQDTRYARSNGSFPSGHTIAAFSVATVIARKYGNHKWIPYVAYGSAALVAFSRLTLSAHFPSDVFMGAALGYSISRFTVLRQ